MTTSILATKLFHLPSVAYNHRRELPDLPGVYFVVEETEMRVVYVGETTNLRTRWGKGHHRAQQIQQGNYRIYWYVIDDPQARAQAEQQCIQFFNPAWNNATVPASEAKRVGAYVRDVASYLGISPDELIHRILADWAYNRVDVYPGKRR